MAKLAKDANEDTERLVYITIQVPEKNRRELKQYASARGTSVKAVLLAGFELIKAQDTDKI